MSTLAKSDRPVEVEIDLLAKKFRQLENEKRSAAEASQAAIRKQRATIEKLTRENRDLKTTISSFRSGRSKISHSASKQLAIDLQKIDLNRQVLEKQLRLESIKAQKLDQRISVVRKSIHSVRREIQKNGGFEVVSRSNNSLDGQRQILENRLDKSLQKFNEAVSFNKNLREKIDFLRAERNVFDSIYRRLENELILKKRDMASIIELANAAYEARDQAQSQMADVKSQADKENADFEKEWKELKRLIDNDIKMKEFLSQKEKLQMESDLGDSSALPTGNVVKKKVNRTAWGIAKDKANVHVTLEKVKEFEKVFAKIQAATGVTDIDTLISKILESEDTNFTLFQYTARQNEEINQIQNRIEFITRVLTRLRSTAGDSGNKSPSKKSQSATGPPKTGTVNISKITKSAGGASNISRDKEGGLPDLSIIEAEFAENERNSERYEIAYHSVAKILTSIRSQVHALFSRLGCAHVMGPEGERLVTAGVSESNILRFISLIEARVFDIVNQFTNVTLHTFDDKEAAKCIIPGGGGLASINTASAPGSSGFKNKLTTRTMGQSIQSTTAGSRAGVSTVGGSGVTGPSGQVIKLPSSVDFEEDGGIEGNVGTDDDYINRPLTVDEIRKKRGIKA